MIECTVERNIRHNFYHLNIWTNYFLKISLFKEVFFPALKLTCFSNSNFYNKNHFRKKTEKFCLFFVTKISRGSSPPFGRCRTSGRWRGACSRGPRPSSRWACTRCRRPPRPGPSSGTWSRRTTGNRHEARLEWPRIEKNGSFRYIHKNICSNHIAAIRLVGSQGYPE